MEETFREAEREAGVDQVMEGTEEMTWRPFRRIQVAHRAPPPSVLNSKGQGELGMKRVREVLWVGSNAVD